MDQITNTRCFGGKLQRYQLGILGRLSDALATIEELKAEIKIKVCTTNAYMNAYNCTHIEYRHTHAHKWPMCTRTSTMHI